MRWSRERVLEELRKTSADGFAPPADASAPLYKAARTYFGTYRAAVRAAGLGMRHRRRPSRWSRNSIVEELRKAARDGYAPRSSKVPRLHSAAMRYWGSYRRAVRAAGLRMHRTWYKDLTKEEVVFELHRHSENGLAPSTQGRGGLYLAAICHFGSWGQACRAAGLVPRGKRWTRAEIIAAMQARGDGIAPHVSEDRKLYLAAIRHFGSWRKACGAAGVEPLGRLKT